MQKIEKNENSLQNLQNYDRIEAKNELYEAFIFECKNSVDIMQAQKVFGDKKSREKEGK